MKPEYRTTLNFPNATNADIIKVVEQSFPKAVEQTKEFSQQFKGTSTTQTAHNVWKFLKDSITYKKDDEHKQVIRFPSWFIHTSEGDCKSYSLLSAAIFANLGLPVSFRYASYNPYSKTPSHVYTVVKDERGHDVIVDGVWKYFNSEKVPSYKYTHPMEVISMSGMESMENDVAGLGRAKRKGGILSFAKKIALAPNRRAFRTIVSLNIFGIARKLAKLHKKNPAALAKFWKKIGGKPSELLKSIKKGYNHWAKRHKKMKMAGIGWVDVAGTGYYDEQRHIVKNLAGVGALPALAAVIAAAAPVVTAVASLIKKNGADKTEPGEPPMDEAVKSSNEIRQSNPGSEQTVNGLTSSLHIGNHLQIGDIRIGSAGLGRAKKKGKFLSRINKLRLAPARRAFRTLIALNAGGMAYKLKRASMRDSKSLEEKWKKMGGKYSELLKSINAGYKRVPAAKKAGMKGIGSEEQSKKASGIAAIAATIIKALAGIFKKHDKNKDGTQSPGESTFEKVVNTVESAAKEFGFQTDPADKLIEQGKADADAGVDDGASAGGSFAPSKTLLIGGGILAAGLVAMTLKKRK